MVVVVVVVVMSVLKSFLLDIRKESSRPQDSSDTMAVIIASYIYIYLL